MRTIKGPVKERGTKHHHTGGWGWVGGVGGTKVKKMIHVLHVRWIKNNLFYSSPKISCLRNLQNFIDIP